MNSFIQKHAKVVMGVLSGFDRLVLRGTLRDLFRVYVMERYLWFNQVLLKDFGRHVEGVTERIKQATVTMAQARNRPLRYLPSAQTSKEDVAREIAKKDGVTSGLICVLSCVEPCSSFEVYRNRETKKLDLERRIRKCLHYYHYWIDPEIGFMNARIQTWFPFTIQICLNGREWLSRSMERKGISYRQKGNCFVWIEDANLAQALMDEQLKTDWPRMLDGIAHALNPVHEEIFREFPQSYYWSVHQSEWATDVLFKSPGDLAALYTRLVRHGMATFGSGDVMRFLGRRVPSSGEVHARFQGEVVTDLRTRPEGVRIKHRANGNSIKLYDKQGSVLRVETTINDPSDFQVYRPKEGGRKEDLQWRKMRRGVADIHRRSQVSHASNERYLEALAEVDEETPLGLLMDRLCHPVTWKGKRHRGLNPWGSDLPMLEAIVRGEYALNGFRNRDLREHLYGAPSGDAQEKRQRSGRTTRHLRLLRAHGLIKKVSHTHRYVLTTRGHSILVALSAARNASPRKLTELAA
jgi:hypothetical protein